MASRYGMGSLRRERLKRGGFSWIYRWYATRPSDGKRVEKSLAIGTTEDFPTERAAWAEVMATSLPERAQAIGFRGNITVAAMTAHYIEHELGDQCVSVRPLSHTTIGAYRRAISLRILPRWRSRVASSVKPLEIEQWLRSLKQTDGLANPTLAKTRNVMSLIYKHGIRHELIAAGEGSNPLELVRCRTTSDFESMTITPAQAHAIWKELPQLEGTLLLLIAATGLRISEALALEWCDVLSATQCIRVRRSWSGGKFGPPKTNASRATVPMHPVLAAELARWHAETPFSTQDAFLFPSFKLKGRQPRSASILVEDYIRPAAIRAGVLAPDDKRRFGAHALRHSLATALVDANVDPKTVQSMLRHADVSTTLGIYAHANSDKKMAAQGVVLDAFFAAKSAS